MTIEMDTGLMNLPAEYAYHCHPEEDESLIVASKPFPLQIISNCSRQEAYGMPDVEPKDVKFVHILFSGENNITTEKLTTDYWIYRLDKACMFEKCEFVVEKTQSSKKDKFELFPKDNYNFDVNIFTDEIWIE